MKKIQALFMIAIIPVLPLHADEDVIRRDVIIETPDGEAMTITQVLRKIGEDQYLVIALEPEDEVSDFYNDICSSMGMRYIDIKERNVILSEKAIHSFTCEK